MIEHLDLVFDNPGGQPLRADLYLPAPASDATPPPVIMFVHGGGWKIGDRKLAPDLRRHFASRGMAMVSIDYRLSGTAPFPAAVEDLKTAIRWVKTVAGHYGYDPRRVGLWGSSAGAHLAALAVTSGPAHFRRGPYQEQDESVRAVVDGYGPTDFLRQDEFRDPDGKPSEDAESIQLPKGKRSADADSMESLFIGAPIGQAPERVAAADPARYVRPGLPPFLIVHGLSDTAVPWQQSRRLFDALAAAGQPATLGLVEGLGHGFFNRSDLDAHGARAVQVYRSDDPQHGHLERHALFDWAARFFSDHL